MEREAVENGLDHPQGDLVAKMLVEVMGHNEQRMPCQDPYCGAHQQAFEHMSGRFFH
jgi:hypothetical protein